MAMDSDFDIVDPRPDALVESLRAFGYTLETALADLLDNSITARATIAEVELYWDGPNSWIRVADNGCGMDEPTLIEAMRAGTKSPLEERNPNDLGRFGLGLKTASFSQCRQLSVLSAQDEKEVFRCWDLDFIQTARKWALLKKPTTRQTADVVGYRHEWPCRTIIVWEKLDRVVGPEAADNEGAHRHFLRKVDRVVEHLGMVFHRFIAKPGPQITILVNGVRVQPWDPFMATHPTTQLLPRETVGSGTRTVVVQPFVLPHQTKLSMAEHQAAAGPKGWNAQQGFYIYRNRRMIVEGDWLGFFRQEEHSKLARIQIDILNASDHDWKIDVRKAHAVPTDDVKDSLKRWAEATRTRAIEVYRHRGQADARQSAEPQVFMWLQTKHGSTVTYKLNREHPMVRRVLEQPVTTKKDLRDLLRVVEETMPVQFVISDFAKNTEQQMLPFEQDPGEVANIALAVGELLVRAGAPRTAVKRRLLAMEPFRYYPEIIESLSWNEKDGAC